MIEQEVEEIMDDEEEIRKKYFLSIYRDGANELAKQLADRIGDHLIRYVRYGVRRSSDVSIISSSNFYQEFFTVIISMTPNGLLRYQTNKIYRKNNEIEQILITPMHSTYSLFDLISKRAMRLNSYLGNDFRGSEEVPVFNSYSMPKTEDITNLHKVFHMLSVGNLDKKLEEALIRENDRIDSASKKDYPFAKIRVIADPLHWKVRWMTKHAVKIIEERLSMEQSFFRCPRSLGHLDARITQTSMGIISLLPVVIEHYKYKKDIINESC